MIEDRLTDYQLTPYKIKLTTPWKTAKHTLAYREGFILKLCTAAGLEANGECAPLPALGTETLESAGQQLENILPKLIGLTINQVFEHTYKVFPATNYAIETALLGLQAEQQNTSICRLINANAAARIKVNTMLGGLDNNILNRAKQAEAQGFSVLKVKTGILPVEEEFSRLEGLIPQLDPQTLLRLDANKAWNKNLCMKIIDRLNNYTDKIDGLEEPLNHYNEKQYRELQRATAIPLALDESFSGNINHTSASFNLPVRRLILKPTAIGGLRQSYRIAKIVQRHNIEVIITSSLETGYGLWANTCLAAAINNNQTHGLATGHWLENTLVPAPVINNGIIHLSL